MLHFELSYMNRSKDVDGEKIIFKTTHRQSGYSPCHVMEPAVQGLYMPSFQNKVLQHVFQKCATN